MPGPIGETVLRGGFFGKAIFLRSQPPAELEDRLGYRRGRLALGWKLLFMLEKPAPDEFEFRGYSHWSGGVVQGHLKSPPDPRTAEQRLIDDGYSMPTMKQQMIEKVFTLTGPERLAKVVPLRPEFGENDYPQGTGITQWELKKGVLKQFLIAAFVKPGDRYLGDFI